jgi:transposase
VVKLPWAEASSRFTTLLEWLAIDWLKAASQKAVGQRLGLSWDEIDGIMEHAVERGLEQHQVEPLPVLGVDGKAFRKGQKYSTLVKDLERSRVLYVASLRECVPEGDAKIVFDKFHIAEHLGEAVDRVRRQENRRLRAAGDDRLAGRRYDWLRNPAAMEPEDRRAFAELRKSGLKTARAWALKETGMAFFTCQYERPARKHFRWWHNWAMRSRRRPMLEVARMLMRRSANIVTYIRHRITNPASESITAKIQWVKYTARGFRNKRNFATAILFHCGALDLVP